MLLVSNIYSDYYILLHLIIVSLILSVILFLVTFSINTGTNILDYEKISAYECGFNPIQSSRLLIDSKFYVIAISFIIFDVELVFLYPWSVRCLQFETLPLATFYLFCLLLVLGIITEYKSQSLNW